MEEDMVILTWREHSSPILLIGKSVKVKVHTKKKVCSYEEACRILEALSFKYYYQYNGLIDYEIKPLL